MPHYTVADVALVGEEYFRLILRLKTPYFHLKPDTKLAYKEKCEV